MRQGPKNGGVKNKKGRENHALSETDSKTKNCWHRLRGKKDYLKKKTRKGQLRNAEKKTLNC